MMKRHIVREQGRWWCLAATVLATGICLAVLAKQPPAERSGQYRTLFDQLLTVADTERDAAFAQRSLITGGLRDELVFPARLRSLVTSWDGSRLFGIPAIEYRHGDGRITLCWETKFRPPGTTEEVRSQFLDRVRSLGFEQVDTDLVTHLRGPYQRIVDRGDSVAQHAHAFRRTSGETIEEFYAHGLEGGLVGGEYDLEINLVWAVSTETDLPTPTLPQLFTACPLLEPPHSEDEILAALAKEPAESFRLRYGRKPIYSDWRTTVRAEVQPRIEAALEQHGFERGQTHDLRPPLYAQGTKQMTWNRTTDATYCHLISIVEDERLKLAYHPPQRVKEPVKRITLDSLSFPNRPQDKDDIRRWEQLASRTSGASWQHEPWYIYAQRSSRDYRTSWRLLQDEDRPLHEIELRVSPYTRDPQKVSWVRLSSLWHPADSGWGADFVCESGGTPRGPSDDPTTKRWYVYFRDYRADSPQAVATLSYFPGLSRYYDIKRLGGTTYDLYVVLESTKSNCVSHAKLKSWIASPQALRDTGLAWVDQLSAKVERQIRSGEAVRRAYIFEERGADHRSASPDRAHLVSLTSHFASPTSTPVRLVSAVPPIQEPPVVRDSDRKLTRDEQDAIIREAQAKFDWQRQQLREHCEQLHAALFKAFPLLDYL